MAMCGWCVDGGDWNAKGSKQALELAIAAHGNCEYPQSCTCQHRVAEPGSAWTIVDDNK